MRNKSIQNTNIQTNTKVQRKDDRQKDTCSETFTQIYSAKKILQYRPTDYMRLKLARVKMQTVITESKYRSKL